MSNKDRHSRRARQARAAKRKALKELQLAAHNGPKHAVQKIKKQDKGASPRFTQTKKAGSKKPANSKKPGFFSRIFTYFGDVKQEMRRVTWPSKSELSNYTVAVVITLIVFGVCIWALDTGAVAALVGFTGLRG